MKKIYSLLTMLLCIVTLQAENIDGKVFELLNLEKTGLEKVKKLYINGKQREALESLIDYYRQRENINHPDIDINNVTISQEEQKWANEGMEHKFFVHYGYQPSFYYGEDINWQYWPVVDNELRWQLHRTKWWQPMGKAYYLSHNEKYAVEWKHQYLDWIAKNPLVEKPTDEVAATDTTAVNLYKNVRFAWRPLEVSHRLQDQTIQFLLFINSPNFTPEFLSHFLVNYHKQATHIINNYSKQGNHLLFEAQRLVYAGTLFPEYKEATNWRKSGIDVLNREIKKQVYDDGMHWELDPHYHLAAINIFAKAIRIADANGFKNEISEEYITSVEKMIDVVINTHLPNYSNPMFSDAKQDNKQTMLNNYKEWLEIYPNNEALKYMATDRQEGKAPSHLSKAFKTSGFYIFRNGWTEDATQMTLKAGPPGEWHNQPDNGTFELYVNGRNFFPDSGSYVYAGDKEVNEQRAWFRQTMVHKTLTLNNQNLRDDSKLLHWNSNKTYETLVYTNPSYENLEHRRSVFFVDNKFFVIVDEAHGTAEGNVAIHYQMCEGDVKLDTQKMQAITQFEDKNNMLVKVFSPHAIQMQKEEGWVSYKYRQKAERIAYGFSVDKKAEKAIRYITVLLPVENEESAPAIKASFGNAKFSDTELKINLEVGKKKYKLGYKLQK